MRRFPYTLRALIGFGGGGVLSSLIGVALTMAWMHGSARVGMMAFVIALAVVQLLPGAIAGSVMGRGSHAAVRTAVTFGIGFIVAWLGAIGAAGSLKCGGTPEAHAYAAAGFAISCGICGAFGALGLGFRFIPAGALLFALAGAIVGPLMFWLMWVTRLDILFLAIVPLAFAVGGVLLGCFIDNYGGMDKKASRI